MKIKGQLLSPEKRKALFGYGAAAICIWSIGFSAAAVQAMERAVPALLLAVFRYGTQTIGVFLILLFKGQLPPVFETRHIPFLLACTLVPTLYNTGFFTGAGFLPLVDAIGITNTAAMVFIAFVHYILKRPVGPVKMFAIILAILGIFMMMQPKWIFGEGDFSNITTENCLQPLFSNDTIKNKTLQTNASEVCLSNTEMELERYIMGAVWTVLAGIAIAIYFDLLNNFGGNFNPLHIAFCTGAFGTILCLMMSLYLEDITLSMTSGTWILLAVHSVCASIDFIMTIVAVSLIGSLKTTIVISLEVIVFMLLQYSFMSSYIPGHKNWLEVVGAIINCIGALLPAAVDLTAIYKYSNPSLNDF